MFISVCCQGEFCRCGTSAAHNIEEYIQHDDPMPHRHPLTAYVCHPCFVKLMGSFANDPLYMNRNGYKIST